MHVERYDFERADSLKKTTITCIKFYVVPLFLFFSIADWFFYPEKFQLFLLLRITTCITTLLLSLVLSKVESYSYVQLISSICFLSCSLSLNIMYFSIDGADNPYYVGLILLVVGLSSGFRFETKFYIGNLIHCIIPFSLAFAFQDESRGFYFLNVGFVLSATFVSMIGRYLIEKSSAREFSAREKLEEEVEFRGEIIDQKTEEGIRLSLLSQQFSPQIVTQIQKGNLNIDGGVHESKVAVVFVDISDSTENLLRMGEEAMSNVLSKFMDDCFFHFLAFDLTIDKFLGDGVLAFVNDPVKYHDFALRAVLAAESLRLQVKVDREFYDKEWSGQFNLRIGIATGNARVGFHGREGVMKFYTAIGTCVNLATRLCSTARKDEILFCDKTMNSVRDTHRDELLNFKKRTVDSIKGFRHEQIAYSLQGVNIPKESFLKKNLSCPFDHGSLSFCQNQKTGLFRFSCRECGFSRKFDEEPLKKSA